MCVSDHIGFGRSNPSLHKPILSASFHSTQKLTCVNWTNLISLGHKTCQNMDSTYEAELDDMFISTYLLL